MNGGGSAACRAVDGDLAFLHRFEQCRLGLRRRSVDLVGEHDVGEQRARLEPELLGRAFVDADADEVGRQQVGGELHPLPRAVDRCRERLGEARLADAGDVLDQAGGLRRAAPSAPIRSSRACRARRSPRWRRWRRRAARSPTSSSPSAPSRSPVVDDEGTAVSVTPGRVDAERRNVRSRSADGRYGVRPLGWRTRERRCRSDRIVVARTAAHLPRHRPQRHPARGRCRRRRRQVDRARPGRDTGPARLAGAARAWWGGDRRRPGRCSAGPLRCRLSGADRPRRRRDGVGAASGVEGLPVARPTRGGRRPAGRDRQRRPGVRARPRRGAGAAPAFATSRPCSSATPSTGEWCRRGGCSMGERATSVSSDTSSSSPRVVRVRAGASAASTPTSSARAIESETNRPLRRTPPSVVETTGILLARAVASVAAIVDTTRVFVAGSVPAALGEPLFDAHGPRAHGAQPAAAPHRAVGDPGARRRATRRRRGDRPLDAPLSGAEPTAGPTDR